MDTWSERIYRALFWWFSRRVWAFFRFAMGHRWFWQHYRRHFAVPVYVSGFVNGHPQWGVPMEVLRMRGGVPSRTWIDVFDPDSPTQIPFRPEWSEDEEDIEFEAFFDDEALMKFEEEYSWH